jgi:hypothetical protein
LKSDRANYESYHTIDIGFQNIIFWMPTLPSFMQGNISGARISFARTQEVNIPHFLSSKKLFAYCHASYCNSGPAQPKIFYQTMLCH